MNVKEYAQDVSKSVEEVLELCKKLGINVSNENDYLDEERLFYWIMKKIHLKKRS